MPLSQEDVATIKRICQEIDRKLIEAKDLSEPTEVFWTRNVSMAETIADVYINKGWSCEVRKGTNDTLDIYLSRGNPQR